MDPLFEENSQEHWASLKTGEVSAWETGQEKVKEPNRDLGFLGTESYYLDV